MIIIAKQNKNNKDLEDRISLLSRIKKEIKQDEVCKDICKEHGFDLSIIDGISIDFDDDIDVSAKTINSKIFLNSGLLEKSFETIMRYVVHELVHAFQHMKMYGEDKNKKEQEYLDDENEVEAFKRQVEFQAKEEGVDKAEDYVEDLIEYHEVPEDERNSKKNELLERVE